MVQSDMGISTSWKRILGMEQSDICFRPSINQDTRKTATWFMLFADTTPVYQILGSRQVPQYRKFLKGICNKANLTNFISIYIMENEHSTREIDNLGWWIQHRKACEERMVDILEMNDILQDISLQTRLAHPFVNVSLLCNSFRGVIPRVQ